MKLEPEPVTGGDILALALGCVEEEKLTPSARSMLHLDPEGIRVDVDYAVDESGQSLERRTCFQVSRDPECRQPDLISPDFASSLVSYAAVKYHIGMKLGQNVSIRDLPSFIRYVEPEKVTKTTGLYCHLESSGVGIDLVYRGDPRTARTEDRMVCFARTCPGSVPHPVAGLSSSVDEPCLRREWELARLLALYLAASYGFPLEIVDNRKMAG